MLKCNTFHGKDQPGFAGVFLCNACSQQRFRRANLAHRVPSISRMAAQGDVALRIRCSGIDGGPASNHWASQESHVSEPLVYLNGHTVPASAAHLAVYDAGVVLGATVSELTRTFRRQPFRLEDHLDRLFRALRYVRFDIGMSPDTLADVSHKLVAHNAELLAGDGELGLIHFVTAGEYPTYAGMAGRAPRTSPTVWRHTFRLPLEMWAEKMRHSAHLVTPATRHIPPECYTANIKCRSRMHYYLADQEARLVDPDATALLLDLAGNVTETSGATFS